jgi:glycosyltransferase involved in cell wall biosynthesis
MRAAQTPSVAATASPAISAIITTHDEGDELKRTLESVVENTPSLVEVIVVDDGSTDGSCQAIAGGPLRVIRHERRLGIARSRDEASRVARGDILCYLDAHQRVDRDCLDRCAQVALAQQAIVCPDLRNMSLLGRRMYGADFRLCPEQGYFSAKWRSWRWRRRVSQITALRAPPYLIPRSLYSRIAWSPCLQGWGASESSITIKSFFTATPILHVGGPLARHLFRRQFHYQTTWDGIWRNQAIIARICFADATWFGHWLPRVFDGHLTDEARATLESAEIQAEHRDFQATKTKTDRQFWTELLRSQSPAGI